MIQQTIPMEETGSMRLFESLLLSCCSPVYSSDMSLSVQDIALQRFAFCDENNRLTINYCTTWYEIYEINL